MKLSLQTGKAMKFKIAVRVGDRAYMNLSYTMGMWDYESHFILAFAVVKASSLSQILNVFQSY